MYEREKVIWRACIARKGALSPETAASVMIDKTGQSVQGHKTYKRRG